MAASPPIDLQQRIEKTIAEEIGPALQMNTGGVEVVHVSEGTVRVRLRNVCTGCPSTIMTIIMGMEQELRRLIPEVEYLEAEY